MQATPGCGDRFVVTIPYYSKVRLNAAQSGSGPFTYAISAGTVVRAFGYAKLQNMDAAGRVGVPATNADTNLQSASRTIGGQRVTVTGLALQLLPNSDGGLAEKLWCETSVKLELNGGETSVQLGKPAMWPGGGGLTGIATDKLGTPALDENRRFLPFPSNGLPGIKNVTRFPEGLIWEPQGSIDSDLNVLLTVERAISLVVDDRAASNLAANVASGVAAYAAPDDGAVFADIMVVLHGIVTSKRSNFM